MYVVRHELQYDVLSMKQATEGKALSEMKIFFCLLACGAIFIVGHHVQAKFMPFEVVLLLSKAARDPLLYLASSTTQLCFTYCPRAAAVQRI